MIMTTMKPKDIHIALKRNDSIEYLTKKFQYSDKEELYQAIRKISPAGAEVLIRKLESRQKISTRKSSTVPQMLKQEESQEIEIPCREPERPIEVDAEQEAENGKQNGNEDLGLEQLKNQEKELSSSLCELEVIHKNLISERRDLVKELEKAQYELKKLKEKLSEQEENVTRLYNRYNECAKKMGNINQECNARKELLEELRVKIANLKKITILIYENGTIEVENADIPTISEERLTLEFRKLIEIPEAGEITVNELRTIAKLKEVTKTYNENDYTFEIIFESVKVQNFWGITVAKT